MNDQKILPLLDGVLGVLQREQRKKTYAKRPELWAYDVLGITLYSKQIEVAHSIVFNHNTMVAACHASGKSFLVAILACWWIDIHPIGEARVLTTAPTTSQVRGIIWREIQKLHQLSRQRHDEYNRLKKRGMSTEGFPDHALPGRVTSSATWRSDSGLELGSGRTPPRGREGDAFQGIHGGVFAIADEAVGVSKEMIDTLGNNTTDDDDRRLLVANPTNPQSQMGIIWHDPIKSSAWTKISISVFDTPKFTGEDKNLPPETVKNLVGHTYVEDKKLEYGVDSANYKARVLGQWAMDSGMILFPDEILELSKEVIVISDEEDAVHLGFDVARSEKGDHSYVYMAQEGWIYETGMWVPDASEGGGDWVDFEKPVKTGRRGVRIRYVDTWRGLPFQPVRDLKGNRTNELAANERVDALMREWGATELRIDGDGMGSLMIDAMNDILAEDYWYEIISVRSNDQSPDRNAWYNNRAYQYSEFARRCRIGEVDLDPEDEKLIDQLRGIEYKIANGFAESILIEKKSVMRAKGIKSPDAADAAWYSIAKLGHLFDEEQVGSRVELDVDLQIEEDDANGLFSFNFG